MSWFYLRNGDGGLPPYTGRIVGSCLQRWKYGIPKDDQPKLQPLLEGLARLRGHGLTVAVVVAAFHRPEGAAANGSAAAGVRDEAG